MRLFWYICVLSGCAVDALPVTEIDAMLKMRESITLRDGSPIPCWKSDDPCTWCNVQCNEDQTHVVSLVANYLNSGMLHPSIGNLTGLQKLICFRTRMHGNIPTSIGNLQFLSTLILSNNGFSGQIPQELGQCSSLTILNLSYNSLNGNLPTSFIPETTQKLFLQHNQLSGSLSPHLFSSLHSLNYIDLSNNKFSGNLPLTLNQLTKLNFFFGNNNNFQGYMPEFSSGQLKGLDVGYNALQGSIPQTLETFSEIRFVFLDHNAFEGPWINSSSWNSLTHLDLSHNHFSGFPESVFHMPKVTSLYLSYNHFEGSLFSVTKTTCSSLVYVYADHNRFSGALPFHWADEFPSLSFLHLQANNLTGWLSFENKLVQLKSFRVEGNQLTGTCDGPVGKSCLPMHDMSVDCVDPKGVCEGGVCSQPQFKSSGPHGTCTTCVLGYCEPTTH